MVKKKKNKYPEVFKKIIKDAIQDFRQVADIPDYCIDIFWMDDDLEEKEGRATFITNASILVERRYLKARIKIYPNLIKIHKEHGEDRIREIVAHEIAHLVTQHLYDCAIATYREEGEVSDAWESLTEVVGRLIKQIHDLKKVAYENKTKK